jgi:hypothetical protein
VLQKSVYTLGVPPLNGVIKSNDDDDDDKRELETEEDR